MAAVKIHPAKKFPMLTYSVAIRTLGLSRESLMKTLQGIFRQTYAPKTVNIYIAEGYEIPDFRVGTERYIYVGKGMMSQRALNYEEIDSDIILMLDDDIYLDSDVAQRMVTEMETGSWDLIGIDIFANHKLSPKLKIKAFLTSLVRPHKRKKIAFRLHPSGAFSYISSPEPRVYLSDTCAGAIMMWRLDSFRSIRATDECWIDRFGFPYGEDALLSYKAKANGLKVGVDFRGGFTNLDAATSSERYKANPERFYIRSLLITMTWWRMLYKPEGNGKHGSIKALTAWATRSFLTLPSIIGASLASRSLQPLCLHIRGIRDGLSKSRKASLPPYIIKSRQ
ncbi:MAG: glycosyltransferase family 2 protein [Duncaniella sp.]|nr:glycosyltransferase family 2 protein [Duncaniella sp.]